MADIDKGQESIGFKLFGTTIAVEMKQVKEETVKERRPDKTIQCPRCKSMETKFCYFNNYNVNQPRHFCKGCQRYWTAGGALRNVPVGAGRRKTKPSSHGQIELSNCVIDVSGVMKEFDFDGVVEQWHIASSSGGFRQVPVKRLCTGSVGQLC